jgi:hypothetical protein
LRHERSVAEDLFFFRFVFSAKFSGFRRKKEEKTCLALKFENFFFSRKLSEGLEQKIEEKKVETRVARHGLFSNQKSKFG